MLNMLPPKSNFDTSGGQTGTRAQAATMLIRMLDKTARVKVDVSKPVETGSIVNAKGQMTPEKSKEYSLKAFETTRFYSEGCKYYLSVDLGTLSDGFKWQPIVAIYSKDGNYLYTSSNRTTRGLTGKQVFELQGVTSTHISNGASARFSLQVITDKNVTSSSQYAINSEMKGKAYDNNVDAVKEQWFNYDTTKQFEGWK